MKNNLIKTVLLSTLALSIMAPSRAAVAGEQKIGYFNMADIFSRMPAAKGLETKLAEFEKELRDEMQKATMELQKKAQEAEQLQAQKSTLKPEVFQMKMGRLQRELQAAQGEIMEMRRMAPAQFQSKQMELMEPIRKEIEAAVERVRKREGYSLVFNQEKQIALLIAAAPEHDLTKAIAKELKLPAQKPTPKGGGSGAKKSKTATKKKK